jgi:DNA-binding transcriptional LysR family regulator
MELDQLKGFYYVAKLGSFTEAAERLLVSQPAISIKMQTLERQLGERLLDRSGRKVRLTHAGSLLFAHVEDLMGKLDEIEKTLEGLKKLEKGRLHLGASDTTSMYFLPDLLKAFRRGYPNVEIRITSLISPHVARKVLDRDLDMGIITLPSPIEKLEEFPLFEQRLVCILSPEHPLASRNVLDLGDLDSEQLILLDSDSVTRKRIDEHLARSRCHSRPAMEFSNFEIIKRYVAAGFGVSLVPEATAQDGKDGVRAVAIRQDISIEIGIVVRRERKLSHAARAFLEIARGFFQGTSSLGPSAN